MQKKNGKSRTVRTLKKKPNKPIGSNKTVANKWPSNKEKPKNRCLSHLILPKF